MAPLSDLGMVGLPAVIRQMAERLEREPPAEAELLWTAAYWLLGPRYPDDVVGQLLQGVRGMQESSTYQAVLARGRTEGRVEGARRMLLLLGEKRFGAPTARTRAVLEAVTELERIEQLTGQVLDSAGWEEQLSRS